jgi:tRNA(His) guanylyltransferase
MSISLKDRIENYQNIADLKLIGRVPVVIVVNGKSFAKTTSLLNKPFCSKFSEVMLSITLKLCVDIEGSVLAYQHNDEVVIVSVNDQNPDTMPWYNNRVQKISSITSSIATLHFARRSVEMELNLMGEAIFSAQVFAVPNVMEAINTLIYTQQHNFHSSVQFACFYHLLDKYDKETIRNMITGLSLDEKIELLRQECQIDFYQYPTAFRRGSICYRAPEIINDVIKNKWKIESAPIFTKDTSFLSNVFRTGADIFRGNLK